MLVVCSLEKWWYKVGSSELEVLTWFGKLISILFDQSFVGLKGDPCVDGLIKFIISSSSVESSFNPEPVTIYSSPDSGVNQTLFHKYLRIYYSSRQQITLILSHAVMDLLKSRLSAIGALIPI